MADLDRTTIAVVDHDAVFLSLLKKILDSDGYEPLICPEGTAAHAVIAKTQPALILLDTWLDQREGGWTLLQTLRLDEATQHIPILLCTSDPDAVKERLGEIERFGKVKVLNKPFDPEVMLQDVREMLAHEPRLAMSAPSINGSGPTYDGVHP